MKDTGHFRKNQEYTLPIEDLGKNGEGIGHIEGYALFVKGALPGDVVRVSITKAGKQFGYARVVEIIEPSSDRVEPACPAAGKCGGCQLMALSYDAQLRYKMRIVTNALQRIGGLDVLVRPILPAAEKLRYRNKAQYPVGVRDGKIVTGFYALHSHRIVPHEDCLLGSAEQGKILATIRALLERYHIAPYDEETGDGLLRHVLIREAFATGEIHVLFVINGAALLHGDAIAEALMAEHRKIVGIAANQNTARGNVILGKTLLPIRGKTKITDRIGDMTYRISPLAFYQVNPAQTKILYDTVKAFAALTGKEHVYDLYCGAGTIGLYLAKDAASVTGIEIVPEAVEDAKENAAANGITNASFYAGAAEELLPGIIAKQQKETREGDRLVIVDPPRKGCAKSLLDTILTLSPEKMIYVSCDPATLARDLRILSDGGYEICAVQPVDCFVNTVHVETVVLLSCKAD